MAKALLFIVGLIAGGALVFVGQGKDSSGVVAASVTGSQVEGSQVEPEVTTPVSPFAAKVQEEESVVQAEEPVNGVVVTTEVGELAARLAEAELRIRELEVSLAEIATDREPEAFPDDPSEEADLALAGFEPATITEIERIRNEAQLERLELRDRAAREGWLDTDRFRQARQELNRGAGLRDALGDDNYDKLLLAEGRNNRVKIEGVIDSSAADVAGLEAGDIVFRYADERIFSYRDLQSATTSGQRDQTVTIQVIRGGEIVDLVIPRGPMGVNLVGVTEDTDP